MDELRVSALSGKRGAVVLQHTSVVLTAQNVLLLFLLGFMFQLNFPSPVALVFQLLILPCASLLNVLSPSSPFLS